MSIEELEAIFELISTKVEAASFPSCSCGDEAAQALQDALDEAEEEIKASLKGTPYGFSDGGKTRQEVLAAWGKA